MKLSEKILALLFLKEKYKNVSLSDGFSYRDFYNLFPEKSKETIRSSLSFLFKRKKIEKIIGKERVRFKISIAGEEGIILKIPAFKKGMIERDEFLRILIFDIPEKRRKWRDNLRERLKETGFFKIQNSLYFSPFKDSEKILDFIKTFKLENFVIFLKVKKEENSGFEKKISIFSDIFDTKKIYQEFLFNRERLHKLLKQKRSSEKKIRQLWQKTKELLFIYLDKSYRLFEEDNLTPFLSVTEDYLKKCRD